jgi:8-oxo-dGTP pyrophosphatase MutT (NUDIX family)
MKQVGAVPYKRDEKGKLRILLVTSRETGRWVIPKGWPMKKIPDHKAASKEAEQEAGVVGKVQRKPIGTYEYFKRRQAEFELIEVTVFPLAVKTERDDWPEMKERERRWFSCASAARMVSEPGLKSIIGTLPEVLK